jgi:hypothetical protein
MTSLNGKIAILLNGPANCGKDTAADALLDTFGPDSGLFRFTVPVKDETHQRYGLDVSWDHYEDRRVKDTALPEFGGLTPREAYIAVGNDLRAKHGPNIVAEMLCDRIRVSNASIVINPDCGGDSEAESIARELGGYEQVLVVRIHKAGCTYDGDCRNWVTSNNFRKVDVVNVAGQVGDYVSTVVTIAELFRNSAPVAVPEKRVLRIV